MERLRDAPHSFIEDKDRAGIVSGIVFGRTDTIDRKLREQFQLSGLWHLLAASGQNVALVIGVCVVGAWLAGAGKLLGLVVAMAAVPLYVLVVGGGPSIVRAGVMGELGILAWLAGVWADTWDALLVAAAVLVWLQPGSHSTLGFQLSFACVVALLAWTSRCTAGLRELGVPRPLAAPAAATLLCGAATAPLLLATVGAAPLLASVSNLIAVPLAAVVLVVGLLAALASLVSTAVALPAFALCGSLADFLIRVSEFAGQLPGASTTSATAVAAHVLAVGAICVRGSLCWRKLTSQVRSRPRRVAGAGLAIAVMLAVAVVSTREPPLAQPVSGTVRFTFIDVGQGDSTLVQTSRHAMLVDTGVPRTRLLGELKRLGVRRLDLLVLTHDQEDHSGAAGEVLRNFEVGRIVVPAVDLGEWHDLPRGRMQRVCEGATVRLEQLLVRAVHPRCDGSLALGSSDPANDNAVVLHLSHGDIDVLLAADAESAALRTAELSQVEALKVAHHGSHDDELPSLLRTLRPHLGVISVGDNPFGHPRDSTLDALRDAGTRVMRTDVSGTISLLSDGSKLRVDSAA